MKLSRFLAASIAAAVLAGSTGMALAQAYPAAQQSYAQQDRGRKAGRFLSPEERKMWRAEHRGETQSMTADQRKAYFRQLRQQYQAMNPAAQANLRSDLQARWNALPQRKQQAIEQRLAQKEQGGKTGQRHGGNRNSASGGEQDGDGYDQ